MAKIYKDAYTSGSQEYQTPPEVYESVLNFIGKDTFDLDVCCTETNIPAKCYFFDSSLTLIWESISGREVVCWMNPPFNLTKDFVKKAYEESLNKAEVWAILPVRAKEKYFQEYVFQKAGFIVFLSGRVKFILDGYQNPQGYRNDCLIAYWGKNAEKYAQKWAEERPLKGQIMRTVS